MAMLVLGRVILQKKLVVTNWHNLPPAIIQVTRIQTKKNIL